MPKLWAVVHICLRQLLLLSPPLNHSSLESDLAQQAGSYLGLNTLIKLVIEAKSILVLSEAWNELMFLSWELSIAETTIVSLWDKEDAGKSKLRGNYPTEPRFSTDPEESGPAFRPRPRHTHVTGGVKGHPQASQRPQGPLKPPSLDPPSCSLSPQTRLKTRLLRSENSPIGPNVAVLMGRGAGGFLFLLSFPAIPASCRLCSVLSPYTRAKPGLVVGPRLRPHPRPACRLSRGQLWHLPASQ